jgi:hypothetical protein
MKHRLPNSGVVRVLKISDKLKCKHENLVKYCIREGYQYYFCMDCGNLIREEIKRGE